MATREIHTSAGRGGGGRRFFLFFFRTARFRSPTWARAASLARSPPSCKVAGRRRGTPEEDSTGGGTTRRAGGDITSVGAAGGRAVRATLRREGRNATETDAMYTHIGHVVGCRSSTRQRVPRTREHPRGEHGRGRERPNYSMGGGLWRITTFLLRAELQDQGRLEDCRDDFITSGEDECPGSIRVLLFTREEE